MRSIGVLFGAVSFFLAGCGSSNQSSSQPGTRDPVQLVLEASALDSPAVEKKLFFSFTNSVHEVKISPGDPAPIFQPHIIPATHLRLDEIPTERRVNELRRRPLHLIDTGK